MFLFFAIILFFFAVFLPAYVFLKLKKPSAEPARKKTFVEYFKNTLSIHKHFLKIESLNNKMTGLWTAMGKPSYPLPEDMIVIKQVTAFFAFIILWLIGFGPISLVIAAAAFFVPDAGFKSQAKKRLLEIERNLPPAIDLLTLCIEGGMDFMAAMTKVIENSEPNPLCNEFQEIIREIQLGSNRRDALLNFAKRCDIDEVVSFISVVVQAEELGTSLVKVLRDYAVEMRIRRWQRAEKLAMEAPTKMLFPMIVFIFPGVFVLIFGPVGLQLVEMF
ncbi:type II secretion system F family protein [bacterium]